MPTTNPLSSEKLASYYANRDARRRAGSTYQAMVEHAVVMGSHTSVKCKVCKGQGFFEAPLEAVQAAYERLAAEPDPVKRDQLRTELSHESTCVVCKGVGYTLARRADRCAAMDSMWTTIRCGRCRGCGEAAPPTDTSAEREDVCLACGGSAYIVPVTVKEKGSTKHGRAPRREAADIGDYIPDAPPDRYTVEPEEVEPERERVALELETIAATDPQLAAGLSSYHGPEGDEWVEHRWGRGFTLWQHTPAGQQLVHELCERSPGRAGFLVDPTKLLAGARERLERQGAPQTRDDSRARVLLGRADVEARELLKRVQGVSQKVEAAA